MTKTPRYILSLSCGRVEVLTNSGPAEVPPVTEPEACRRLLAHDCLLAACVAAEHEINRPDGTMGSALQTLKLLRAAIAKAES